MRLLAAMLLYTSCISLHSQQSISGVVEDGSNQPIMYANVMLMNGSDSTYITGTNTDTAGIFNLKINSQGVYYLEISSIGYLTLNYELNDFTDQISIVMSPASELLDEVVVKGQRSMYELKSDRLVVNIASQISMSGNNALQLLKKVPGVIIQENQNSISLNNKGGVLVMINNRITRVPREVLIQQLQGMQAENIERIEVIHQPSARYDADNAAGIIHIVMKKRIFNGMSGNINTVIGYGQAENGSIGGNLNFRQGNLNIYGSASAVSDKANNFSVNHYREYDFNGDNFFYENLLNSKDIRSNNISAQSGIDWQLNDKFIVGALAGYSDGKFEFLNSDSNSTFQKNNAITDVTNFGINTITENTNYFYNLNLNMSLSESSNINVDFDQFFLDAQNGSQLDNQEINAENDKIRSQRISGFDITTFKSDYTLSTDAGKLELGVKGTYNRTTTAVKNESLISGEWVNFDVFNIEEDLIKEDILAMYGTYQKRISSEWDIEMGARYENFKYNLAARDEINNLSLGFKNLFPVVRINHKIDSLQSLQLTYNRRTDRPQFSNLAAFYLLVDPTLLANSNTRLRPSFTNTLALSFQRRSMILMLEGFKTAGFITFYNTVDKASGIQTSQPINFDKLEALQLTLSQPIYFSEAWESSWNLQGGYYRILDASNRPIPYEDDILSFSIQGNNSFNLGRGWYASLDGKYTSEFISGDQRQFLYHFINAGIRKKLGNHSFNFVINDISNSSGKIDWEYDQPALGIRTFGNNNWSERTFLMNYTYTFQTNNIKASRQRSTASSEERSRM